MFSDIDKYPLFREKEERRITEIAFSAFLFLLSWDKPLMCFEMKSILQSTRGCVIHKYSIILLGIA